MKKNKTWVYADSYCHSPAAKPWMVGEPPKLDGGLFLADYGEEEPLRYHFFRYWKEDDFWHDYYSRLADEDDIYEWEMWKNWKRWTLIHE